MMYSTSGAAAGKSCVMGAVLARLRGGRLHRETWLKSCGGLKAGRVSVADARRAGGVKYQVGSEPTEARSEPHRHCVVLLCRFWHQRANTANLPG